MVGLGSTVPRSVTVRRWMRIATLGSRENAYQAVRNTTQATLVKVTHYVHRLQRCACNSSHMV